MTSPSYPSSHAGGPDEPRTITKKELVARIAEKTNQTKVVAKDIIQMFLDEIIRELGDGNRLEFREFGVFEIKERAARKAQNPRTLEKVDVPAKRVVKFKVGRLMKECVTNPPRQVTPPQTPGQRPPAGPQGPPAGPQGGSPHGGSPTGGGHDPHARPRDGTPG
jgi:integration host factor subunit beta